MTVPSDASSTVDASRLWTGGLATALVAALVAFVGVLICRGLLDVPVLAPTREGALGDADTARLAALAALAALLATGLLHLLLLSTPRPIRFFTWIVTLATIAAALAPFLTDADLDEKVATSRDLPRGRPGDRLAADRRGPQRRAPARLRAPVRPPAAGPARPGARPRPSIAGTA